MDEEEVKKKNNTIIAWMRKNDCGNHGAQLHLAVLNNVTLRDTLAITWDENTTTSS